MKFALFDPTWGADEEMQLLVSDQSVSDWGHGGCWSWAGVVVRWERRYPATRPFSPLTTLIAVSTLLVAALLLLVVVIGGYDAVD